MFHLSTHTEFDYLPQSKECLVHFLIKIKTDPLKQERKRKALNVSLVLDRSGSMGGKKMEYTKKAAAHLIERLQDDDLVSLVIYDNEVETLSLPVSGSKKDSLTQSLKKALPRGMTNLSAGWLTGLSLVQKNLSKDRIHRVLLMTDGNANEGIVDPKALEDIGRAHLNQGVTTSCFGFGNDFNETLLTQLADHSGGNFYFIESPEKAPEAFLEELGELASIIGQNMEVFLRCEAGVEVVQNLSKFPGSKSQTQLSWKVGDLYANDTRLLVGSVKVPAAFAQDPGQRAIAQIGLRFQSVFEAKEKCAEAPLSVFFSTEESQNRGPNEEVLREVLTLKSAFIKEEATELADRGDWEGARAVLTQGSNSIRAAVSGTPSMSAENQCFLSEEADICETMRDEMIQEDAYSPYAKKMMLTQAYQMKKQRGRYGK
jgi:Ca-activated chloride channel homolog